MKKFIQLFLYRGFDMKKIFFSIGLLLSIYSIAMMMLFNDVQLYLNDDPYTDITLNQSMTMEELEDYAKDVGVVIQVREYMNAGLGNYRVNIYALNLKKDGGRKKSLFPGQNIQIIKKLSKEKYHEKVQMFMVQTKQKQKVNELLLKLQRDGYEIDVLDEGSTAVHLNQLFSTTNIEFYALMFVLILSSTIIYYLTRIKEIGVKKMQGWTSFKIAVSINKRIAIWSLLGILPLSLIFAGYICIKEIEVIVQYLYLLSILVFLLMVVYILSVFISSFFVRALGCVAAIKANKNEKLMIIVLTVTKIVTTVLICGLFTYGYSMFLDIDGMKSEEKVLKNNYYTITTSVTPSEKEMKEINDYLKGIDDAHVYNYTPPERTYRKSDLKKKKRVHDIESLCENNVMEVSYNMIEKLGIKFADKEIQDKIDKSTTTVMIPQYLKAEKKNVLNQLYMEKNTNVIFIRNDQNIADILYPGEYFYDPIIVVTPLKKQLYINAGEVLYDKEGAKEISTFLIQRNYGKSRVAVQSIKMDIQSYLSARYVDFYEAILWMIVSMIAFCFTSFALVISIIEYRKKAIAVYRLNGKRTFTVLAFYIVTIISIDIAISMIWMWQLCVIIFMELMFFGVELHHLLKNGAARIINGE